MNAKQPPIWDQLPNYLSSEDLQAIGENSILDYLRTKYGTPEENTVQADLTEFVFNIQDRNVRFWQQNSTGELIGIGGDLALFDIPCPKLGQLVAVMRTPSTITVPINPLSILSPTATVLNAIGQIVAIGTPFEIMQAVCTSACGGPQCSCVPVPTVTNVTSTTVNTRFLVPISVTANVIVTTNVLCLQRFSPGVF